MAQLIASKKVKVTSVVPRSRFVGDKGVPLPEFQGDIYKFWGTHQIFTFLIE